MLSSFEFGSQFSNYGTDIGEREKVETRLARGELYSKLVFLVRWSLLDIIKHEWLQDNAWSGPARQKVTVPHARGAIQAQIIQHSKRLV